MTGSRDTNVLVIGAGPAGLAVAACLIRRGIVPVIVDRGAAVGDSWRGRYDRLHLHTPRVQSALPGLRIPARFGRWVARDDVVRYLRGYARYHGINPELGVDARRIDRAGDRWRIATNRADMLADQVVVATGYNRVPRLPDWPGREGFPGAVRHASTYTTPAPYRDRAVLVVGSGNTGAEIAADLAEAGAARVWLAVRTPPHVMPRAFGPVPVTLLSITQDFAPPWVVDPLNRRLQRWFVGDLRPYGLPRPARGLAAQFRATDVVPIIDVGLVAQLRAGGVEPVAALTRFDGDEAVLADDRRLRPDAVIAATGYTRGLEALVGHLGILDAAGRPLVHGAATHPAAPGLRFVGLSNPLKGLLLQINLDARAVARAVARERRRARTPRTGALGAPGAGGL